MSSPDHGVVDRPTVLLVAGGVSDLGGQERAMAEAIRRGHRRWRFVVLAKYVAPDLEPLVEWVHVRAPYRPFPPAFVLFWVLAPRHIKRIRADLVHVCGAIVPSRVDLASMHFCHRGFADSGATALTSQPSPARRLNTWLAGHLARAGERWCYRPGRVRSIAAVSEGVAREVGRYFPGVPVVVTPNGVDLDRFRPDGERRAAVRANVGIPDDDVVALFVGGDWERKGLEVALRGIAAADVARLRLWVVGAGDAERYAALAAELGLGDRVTFFGRRDDTERYYSAADVFVFPSAYEADPLVTYEALAAGLPVVGSAVSGVEDLVDDSVGRLVQRTPAAIGAALRELAEDDTLRRSMAERARVVVADRSWDRSWERLEAEYQRLLATRGHR